MRSFHDFLIGGIGLRIIGETASPIEIGLRGFKPFITELTDEPHLTIDAEVDLPTDWWQNGQIVGRKLIERFDFEERICECVFARDNEAYWFGMFPAENDFTPIIMRHRFGSKNIDCNAALNGARPDASLYRFGLWVAFGLVSVPNGAIPIHTSTIVCNDRAVLFLGESGTGKSTHTRLWRENIEGAHLLNDDSPIISSTAVAYGSPWSGKTPCYRNLHYPIAAIVRLSQAPHNRMRRLSALEALGALLPSCPPSFAYDEELQDAVCETLSSLISTIPVYHLECLPNAEAAELSYSTIFGK